MNSINTVLPDNGKDISEISKKYNFFTWTPQNEVEPIAIKETDGCYFTDYDGNRYFDLSSQQVYMNIGFNNQKVISAVQEQVAKMANVAPHFTTDIRAALGKKIIEDIAPDNMSKVLFTLGGADANEYAIRIAKKYTGRYKIFSQYYSYHGSTYGATNLNGEDDRVSPDPTIAGFVHFFGPNWRKHGIEFKSEEEKCDFYVNMLREQMILEGPETIAAIFFESITGTNGAIIPPEGYYQKVRKLCDEFGILMVCDEVMVGFGRTGKWFACEHFGYEPDIITFAKGSTCGYVPMGGVLVSKKIADFYDEAKFPCGLTYNAHAVSLATSLATIEVYEEEKLLENAQEKGKILLDGLKVIKEKHPCIGDVRGIGLMNAFELIPEMQNYETHAKLRIALFNKGYCTVGHYGALLVAPPLIVTEEECKGILAAIDEVLYEFDKLVP